MSVEVRNVSRELWLAQEVSNGVCVYVKHSCTEQGK